MRAQGPIRAKALSDMPLLAQVVRHKETFYPSAWARYDIASAGSMRLMPVSGQIGELKRAYRDMQVMIFGEPPAFDQIMATLAALEDEINAGHAIRAGRSTIFI